ncbi:hypothetical protein RUND412_008548 [Rhizina undulata]
MATLLEPVKSAPQVASTKSEHLNGREPPSPAPTSMSFRPGDDRSGSKSPNSVEFITRDIGRDSPASPGPTKKSFKGNMNRKRSVKNVGYYGEIFAVRESGPVVPKSAGVWVELKTNVILENEFDFAKSISEMIAKRYGRTEDNVCVSIDHSACMIMGGSFDGSYLLTITSLSMVSPTCNKRNTALISDWINNNLGVPPHRGFIRFIDPDFANYAMGGSTMLDLMERDELARTGLMEKAGVIRDKSVKRAMSKQKSRKERERDSFYLEKVPQVDEEKEGQDSVVELPLERISSDGRPGTAGGTRKKRSMFNLFHRAQKE